MKQIIVSLVVLFFIGISFCEEGSSSNSGTSDVTSTTYPFCDPRTKYCGGLRFCPFCSSGYKSDCEQRGGEVWCDLTYCYCRPGPNIPPVPKCSSCFQCIEQCYTCDDCSISHINGKCLCGDGSPCRVCQP